MSSKTFIAGLMFLALCLTATAQDPALIIGRYKQMLEKNPTEGIALDRLWKLYQEKSETGQLLADYKQAAEKNDFSSTMVLGLLLRKAGQTDDAVNTLQHAATLNPQSSLPHLSLAEIFSGQSKPKDSAAEYEIATGLMDPKSPGFADALFKLGSARLTAGDPAKASEAWERVITIDPKNLALRQRLAETYVANNLPDAAVAHYEYIEENGDVQQRALALQSMARISRMKGDADAAIQSLEKAIDLTAPGNWLRNELQEQLIRQYQRAHRTAELEEKWKKTLEENPRDAGAYLQLTGLYERTGDLDQQCAVLQKLSDLLPDNLDYKTRLARLYSQLNQPDKAAELLDQLLKAQPANADALFARAEIDMQHDAPQAAHGRIEAFLQQHRDDELLRTRAVDFYSSHRLFDAVEEHLKASHDENSVLALAAFYFSQHRNPDAKRTLQLLVKSDDHKEKQAAAHMKIASALKDQKETQGALEELKLAVALQPEAPEYHLAQGDLLTVLNRLEEAQAELEKAWQFAKDEPARLDADTKLFHTFQIRPASPEQKEDAPVSIEELLHLGGPVLHRHGLAAPAASNKALENYIDAMAQAAEQHPSPEAMLRIARWKMWSSKEREAVDFAQKAVELKPDSVANREALVKIASAMQRPAAIAQLQELVKLNPGKELVYRRQIGRLLWESGKIDEATQLFSDLEKSKPGDVDVLSDLALALQQTNRWDDALAAWQRAFDLAPPPRRKEIMPSLVRALERSGANQKAAEVLSGIADAQSDENERTSIFQDLLVFCAKHELTGWLQSQYEQKLRANADDYFAQTALAKILKANGRDVDSFALLSDAAFSAPDQVAALRELVAGTEEKGDFETAISCQKRILPLVALNDPGDMKKLAGLQEGNLDLKSADSTWDRIITKFSRDTAALSHAADYFQRWGSPEKSRVLLRKICSLEPDDLQTWTRLARLASDTGDQKEALTGLEKILQNSIPADEKDHLKFPEAKATVGTGLEQAYFTAIHLRNGQPNSDTMRALRSFWSTGSEKTSGDSNVRLDAIRSISTLLKKGGDKAAMQAWLTRWQTFPPVSASETLWAFYYSGAHDLVLKQLAGLMQRYPDNQQIKQGFAWIALQMGEYEALNRWLADKNRTPDERDFFIVSLGQLIATADGRLDPKLVDGLFPPEYKSLQNIWQAAVQFASHGYFAQAIKLGERVFRASVTLRPVYGLELAHWHIYAGDIDGARAVLKTSIEGTGDSLDSMLYADLREYYLLLPVRERDSFVESYSRTLEENPLHSALAMSLLYGLQGNYDKAREQTSKLLALRPMATRTDSDTTPSYRTWTFILTAGVQFQLWRLAPLSVDLWEKSLADEASISLQGNQVGEIVREIRMRLFAEKLADADAGDVKEFLDDYLQSTPPEIAGTLASVLENSGYNAQSEKIYQWLWHSQPDNQHFLQSLLNACRAANDTGTEKSVLKEAWSRAPQPPAPNMGHLQIALELIHRQVADSEERAARKVAEEALHLFPQHRELLIQAANLYARQQRYDIAEKAYRQLLAMQPGDAVARDSLINVLVSAGKTEAAIEVLAHPGAPDADESAWIAKLYLKSGEFDKAGHAAQLVLQSHAYDKIPELAAQFYAKGRDAQAKQMLLAALSHSKDTNTLFALLSKLLENLPANTPPELVDKLLARLDGFVPDGSQSKIEPDLQTAFYNLQEILAKKFHREERWQVELAADWRNGEGRPGAGLKLLQIQAQGGQTEKLRAICESFFARADFNEQVWSDTQPLLEQAKQYDLLARGWELLALKNPIQEEPILQYIKALVSSGKKEDAATALEKLGCRHVFSDAAAPEVAQEYCREGDYDNAGRWFDIAIKKNPSARMGDVYFQYASMLLDRKNFPEAKRILLEAFRNPVARDTEALARYFIESGRADRIGSELREFGLAPEGIVDFHAQLVLYYQQHGEPLKAIAVAEEHPEIIISCHDVAKWMHAAALAAGAFEKTAALLEKEIAQSPDGVEAGVSDALALIYRDWPDPVHGLDHLKRALELKPEDLEIVTALSKLYLEKQQPQLAVQVLIQFIGLTQDQARKEQAKALLAKIPAG